GAGGAGGNGRVLTYAYTTPPINGINQYYPISLYSQVTSNSLTYSLYQSYAGGAQSLVVSPANSLSYVPPANQLAGYYAYNVLEQDSSGSVSVYANITINMTD